MLRIRFGWTTWFLCWLFCWLRSLFRGLLGCRRWLFWLLCSKLIWFECWNIISFFGKDSYGFSNGKRWALVVNNSSDVSFISRLKGNGCFISLNFTDCISDINLISLLNTPFNNFTFSHGRWQCWHLYYKIVLRGGLDVWVIQRKRRHCY